ncbi:hypothetical protein DRH29_04765 [candidate division Kazan bacterium]|uniref:TIGR04255 family protein n=1 Tax=candidate division Kazan bacterium TaxID=2202143 RepID=A0A420ZBG8_UNCK3|nr:MAG: hypothetical protein DRH29_04765 [candidate division Kazan bacterium]
MKVENNFVSIVVIGNFNPAIATTEFVANVCDVTPEKIQQKSPEQIQVIRQLEFENFRLEITLERFVLVEKNIEDIYRAKVADFFGNYFKKLSYTPLKAAGFNINCDFSFDDRGAWEKARKKVERVDLYLEFFSANEVDVLEIYSATKEKKYPREARFKVEGEDRITRQINTNYVAAEILKMNYNWEVRRLDKNIENLYLLLDRYKEFCEEFFKFIENMRSG